MLDVIALTKELCAIPSITGEEAAVVAHLDAQLTSAGWTVARQNVGGVPGRDNLLATRGAPRVLLTTHIDTVPPHFDVTDDGTVLTGRGVCDAKGIAAAMICAAERLVDAGEDAVGLLFVVGEETDSDGARAAADGFVPNVDFLIDGEPTDLKLTRAMKGALTFELEVEGKAGHSAYLESGKSAVHQLVRDLNRLLEEAWPNDDDLGPTTLNAGVIEGGVAPNVHAPHAKARLIMRTTDDVERLTARIRALLSEGTRLAVRSGSGPVRLHTVDGEDTCVVAFGSDVPYLAPLGACLLIGPGSILDAHTSHEQVRHDDLQAAVDTYARLATALLAEARGESSPAASSPKREKP